MSESHFAHDMEQVETLIRVRATADQSAKAHDLASQFLLSVMDRGLAAYVVVSAGSVVYRQAFSSHLFSAHVVPRSWAKDDAGNIHGAPVFAINTFFDCVVSPKAAEAAGVPKTVIAEVRQIYAKFVHAVRCQQFKDQSLYSEGEAIDFVSELEEDNEGEDQAYNTPENRSIRATAYLTTPGFLLRPFTDFTAKEGCLTCYGFKITGMSPDGKIKQDGLQNVNTFPLPCSCLRNPSGQAIPHLQWLDFTCELHARIENILSGRLKP